MPKYKYNVGVQFLDGQESGKTKVISERMINSYDTIDDAIDCLLKNIYLSDKYTNITKEDVLEDIDYSKELFENGNRYRVILENIKDCANKSTYYGPGGYIIEKASLQ